MDEAQPEYVLLKGKAVYKYNGRFYQVSDHGVVFDISAIQPDPHFPGYLDITAAICTPYDVCREVLKVKKEQDEKQTLVYEVSS